MALTLQARLSVCVGPEFCLFYIRSVRGSGCGLEKIPGKGGREDIINKIAAIQAILETHIASVMTIYVVVIASCVAIGHTDEAACYALCIVKALSHSFRAVCQCGRNEAA